MKDLDMFLLEEEQKMRAGGRTDKQEETESKSWGWKMKCWYCFLGYAYLIGYFLYESGYGG